MMNLVKLQDLTGRVALVTGGSRGLGLKMAEVLGELGAKVAITARKRDELDAAAGHPEVARNRGAAVGMLGSNGPDTHQAVADRIRDALVSGRQLRPSR
jgi:NAD(P)-dependent dehydrogenase (short-subunit alcohol dehydrogenase family)